MPASTASLITLCNTARRPTDARAAGTRSPAHLKNARRRARAAAATAAAVAGLLYLRRLHRDLAELRGQLQKVEHMDRRRRGSNAGTAVQKSIVHTDQGLRNHLAGLRQELDALQVGRAGAAAADVVASTPTLARRGSSRKDAAISELLEEESWTRDVLPTREEVDESWAAPERHPMVVYTDMGGAKGDTGDQVALFMLRGLETLGLVQARGIVCAGGGGRTLRALRRLHATLEFDARCLIGRPTAADGEGGDTDDSDDDDDDFRRAAAAASPPSSDAAAAADAAAARRCARRRRCCGARSRTALSPTTP